MKTPTTPLRMYGAYSEILRAHTINIIELNLNLPKSNELYNIDLL